MNEKQIIEKKKFYVSTPIYYPNNHLHIGHAYTTVLADIINRYKKMQDYDTYFVTGSDEHGQKIFLSAQLSNEEPLKYLNKMIENFKILWDNLGIDYDHFVRTTDNEHISFVQNKFSELLKQNKIYKGNYLGLYCIHDEEFFTKTQANNGLCPNCNRKLTEINEETYFLKIFEYKDWIENKLKFDNFLIPKSRSNELLKNFIPNLQDLSITRKKVKWGILVKEDPNHTIYVWFDALNNYLSTLSYGNKKWKIEDVWSKNVNTEILQIIGKEITRFHAIYWPIILEMFDYKTPKILSHGWIVDDFGEKMSKSKNNFFSPNELINKYGKDTIRFFLINNISVGEDGKFSEELLIKNINGILVNKYSNLVNRIQTLLIKKCNGVIPDFSKTNYSKLFFSINQKIENLRIDYVEAMNNFSFFSASKIIVQFLDELNFFIDKNEIWNMMSENLDNYLNFIFTQIWNLSILVAPILIDSTKNILKMYLQNEISFKDWNKNFANTKINKIEFLFKRI